MRKAAEGFDGAGCWEWPGSRNPATAYGQLSNWEDGKRVLLTAHRVSFRAFCGAIPEGQQVLHRCDNKPCFNPAHLFLGDQLANMRDMSAKGRGGKTSIKGSAHTAAKLKEADVIAIRASREPLTVLARRYGDEPFRYTCRPERENVGSRLKAR